MYNDNETLMEVINIINKLTLQNTLVLIGSWAEYFYQRLFDRYYSSFRTLDTDFLIRRPVQSGKGFVKEMKEIGFTYEEDPLTGKSKFFKNDIEVEFLTTLTRDYSSVYNVPEMGIHAECLKYMDIAAANTIPVVFTNGNIILVPNPAAYVIQKAMINSERSEAKAQKDIVAIRGIVLAMLEDNKYVQDFVRIYQHLGKKQKRRVDDFAEDNDIIELRKLIESAK